MPINSSIAMGYQAPRFEAPDPVSQFAKGLQLKSLMQKQTLDEQAQADDAAQREAFRASGGDEAAYLKALMQGGQVGAYQKAQKAIQDRQAAAAKNAKAGVDTQTAITKRMEMYREGLAGVTTPEQALSWVQAQYSDPVLGPVVSSMRPMEAAISSVPRDPTQFDAWLKQNALGMSKYIEKNAPHYFSQDTGGQVGQYSVPGLGGAVSPVQVAPKVQSPDNAASNARMAADAAAARAQADRHFNASQGLQRERLEFEKTKDGQKADKPLTDAQAKANLFGTRMQEAHRILNELDGKYWPGAVNAKMAAGEIPLVGGVAGYAGNVALTEQGQQAEQAQRDFINAVLRRESGAVISPSEFSNANKQYFPQPGDSPAVLKQKKANRQLAIDGLALEVPGGFRSRTPTLTSPGNTGGASGDFGPDPLGLRKGG